MRRKHTYGLAFLAVFAAALAGFMLARRFVGPIELPRFDAVARAETIFGEIDINSFDSATNATTQSHFGCTGNAGRFCDRRTGCDKHSACDRCAGC